MKNRLKYTVTLLITLGIVQFISFWVLYSITATPTMLHNIIAISDLGMWLILVMILPGLDSPDPDIPDRIEDLIQKSWNEGLDSGERDELRVWMEDEEEANEPYYRYGRMEIE